MKKVFITIASLLITNAGLFAQSNKTVPVAAGSTPIDVESEIYRSVDQIPKPSVNISQFLSEHIQYPNAAIDSNIEGTVYVNFVVEKDGSISNVYPKKGKELGGGLAQEAVRVVKRLPAFTPGKKNNRPVRTLYTVPIAFKLQNDDSNVQDTTTYNISEPIASFPINNMVQQYANTHLKPYPTLKDSICIVAMVEADGSISSTVPFSKKMAASGMSDANILLTSFIAQDILPYLKTLPKLTPAKLNGAPVSSVILISFILNEKTK